MLLRSEGALAKLSLPVVRPEAQILRAELGEAFAEVGYTLQSAWQSNGGPVRGHAARAYPFFLDIDLGPLGSSVRKVHLLGVFALYATREDEVLGTMGASIHLLREKQSLHHHHLANGRHYSDAADLAKRQLVLGDGSSVVTVGIADIGGKECRLDLFTLDIPEGLNPTSIRFKDLAGNSSFVIFNVYAELAPGAGCPFRGKSGRIALSEIPAIVRVGDRVKFKKAILQLEEGLENAEDLDEARSQSLTFLAMVTATMLETGGSRSMHRVQLEAARELERMTTRKLIAQATVESLRNIAGWLVDPEDAPTGSLMTRAMEIVERNFAKDLSDEQIATQLGLSTSHFRFLFRQTTGQPFHRYLIALRLEKARELIVTQHLPVSSVARAVGFSGLAHFSRAFTQRFGANPSELRKGFPGL